MIKYILTSLLAILVNVSEAKIIAKVDGNKSTLLMYDDKCEISPFHKFTIVDGKGQEEFNGCWLAFGRTFIFLETNGEVMQLDRTQIKFSEGL